MIRFPLALLASTMVVGVAAPSASPPLPFIAAGVTIGGHPVAGLTSEQARAKLVGAFDRPLRFGFYEKRWTAMASRLGATPHLSRAIAEALTARPRTDVRLRVSIQPKLVNKYVRHLARRFAVPPKDAELTGLNGNLAPVFTEAKPGRKVWHKVMAIRITRALRRGSRDAIPLRVLPIQPNVTVDDFGSIVVIRRESKRLYLYNGRALVRTFGVATGTAQYPTPLGRWSIVTKQRDPWWIPPKSDWAKGLKPVPPGPGNPLGTRWMGLSAAAVGIHGTPDAASIGYSASHGCIRMLIPDATWLFEHVAVGTPVFIVSA